MEVCRRSSWLLPLLGVILFAEVLQAVQDEVEIEGPSESQCRPYIEKALKELEHVATDDVTLSNEELSSIENIRIGDQSDNEISSQHEATSQESQEQETTATDDTEQATDTEEKTDENSKSEETQDTDTDTNEDADDTEQVVSQSQENKTAEDSLEDDGSEENAQQPEQSSQEAAASTETVSIETVETVASAEQQTTEDVTLGTPEETTQEETDEENLQTEEAAASDDATESDKSDENETQETEENEEGQSDDNKTADAASDEDNDKKESDEDNDKKESGEDKPDDQTTEQDDSKEQAEGRSSRDRRSAEDSDADESTQQIEENEETDPKEVDTEDASTESEQLTNAETTAKESSEGEQDADDQADKSVEDETVQSQDAETQAVTEDASSDPEDEGKEAENESKDEQDESKDENVSKDKETEGEDVENDSKVAESEGKDTENESNESDKGNEALANDTSAQNSDETKEDNEKAETQDDTNSEQKSDEETPEDDLTILTDIPKDLRPRDHVEQLLKIDREATKTEEIIDRISEITLRDLKRLYENAIKPLETLYKYRDLSNRHYGDAEIFSKPLILFMGPWSGGKSSIINYLLNIEYNETALQTGAEPSPAYFNLLMHGEETEILDGTQLAADYTFSGLQKFGQGLEERLRGVKLPNKLLEKVNFVEIPGILEVRKQVSRVFPFNDACQWFIDRADIIFLVYDPSKLDVGPETEAILDQLKGREYQTRIVLNKADLVKPEELMRVQGALIWNISPLMSSPQPPVMYTTSLWSRPYEQWAPIRLLQAQERAFLRDLRTAIDRRIENKIASARRFAVRVRNHAKMVDCYLTTYYNHKSIFGNKKKVSDEIIEHPQDYHIYEGLSTLTNISRYDLPDPDVYKDFFRLNPLYEFQQLAATCTYFRGCPINKLDVAIAYDLPELVGKHKRHVEAALAESNQEQPQGS